MYYTRDALLENLPVLIFFGPSTTGNSTQNSSLVQAHIYTLAGFQPFPRDVTGIAAFAKILLKWFPKFTDPYQEFMRASSTFQAVVNEHLQDTSSSFSRIITDIGEQQLRSALIEPVQRLPRYSLFIDNMVNLLPALHPGLASLLKAPDMITDICALDSLGEYNHTISCLKNLITDWPSSFSPGGRLITAVDVRQLSPPYQTPNDGRLCVLLLFSDALILLQKVEENVFKDQAKISSMNRMNRITDLIIDWDQLILTN